MPASALDHAARDDGARRPGRVPPPRRDARRDAARLDPATPSRRDGWPEFFANERMRVLVESALDAVDARAGIAEHFADDG